MRNRNRSNVLLVEILIAVLFFMLSATVLVRVFVAARNMTVRAAVETQALAEAQNVADTIYAAADPDQALEAMEFKLYHGAWSRASGDFTLYVEGGEEPAEAGSYWRGTVRAFYHNRNIEQVRPEDEELFAIPCTRYREAQA